jgi:D-tyrosyl-tRNA(Tyr) deacylase
MRAVVQRVTCAAVRVAEREVASDQQAAERLAQRVRALRVFPDAAGRMNEPLGTREILCISQFTLYGDTRRGNRPSFVQSAPPELAEPLYERFCAVASAKRGVFGAHMQVELVNDGPVTLLLEWPLEKT